MRRRNLIKLFFQSRGIPITRLEWLPVRATARTWWLNLRLTAADGVTGLGEASDGFGLTPAVGPLADQLEAEVRRQLSQPLKAAPRNITEATAHSALAQAQIDIEAKRLGKPLVELLGGARRKSIPVYANINRAAKPRTPAGFAAVAKRAWADGFRAVKAAPFDGGVAVPLGVECVYAIREALGPEAKIMVDAHSLFGVASGIALAKRLEGARLTWFEEPVAPELVRETTAIRRKVNVPMAAGETLYGVEGFRPLCRARAVETIMPDVKHCGGPRELVAIARMAQRYGVKVSPHNPSGPVATAFSLAAACAMENCEILELQYGEVDWRAQVVSPPERITDGSLALSTLAGCGIVLGRYPAL
jgi:galactonate dehydratase